MPYTKFKKITKPRKFDFLPPVPPKLNSGCLNCGLMHTELPPDAILGVGFGQASLTRDGRTIWYEGSEDFESLISCADAEKLAAADPEHDWRIFYLGPLSDKEYQRQDGKWILVRTGMGFA